MYKYYILRFTKNITATQYHKVKHRHFISGLAMPFWPSYQDSHFKISNVWSRKTIQIILFGSFSCFFPFSKGLSKDFKDATVQS